MTTAVFIGGPLDRKTKKFDGDPPPYYTVPDNTPTLFALDTPKTGIATYTLRCIYFKGVPAVYFYTAGDLTDTAALMRVLNAYVKE